MKHIGKMKNNNAKIVVVYRTLPNDPYNALVVGTSVLPEVYHNALMNLVQDQSAQQAYELAEILSVRKFPDGSNMLSWLHVNGHLKKVATNLVLLTPNTQTSIQLDELNKLIAEQKGINIEDLAINDGSQSKGKSIEKPVNNTEVQLTATQLREKAASLIKEAKALTEQADLLEPPVKKSKSKSSETVTESV